MLDHQLSLRLSLAKLAELFALLHLAITPSVHMVAALGFETICAPEL